jgi:hypothetical protein
VTRGGNEGPSIRPALAAGLLLTSASGYPATQLVVRLAGRRGVLVGGLVAAGLFGRDLAMTSAGVPASLRPGPAWMLRAETLVSGAAAVASAVAFRQRAEGDDLWPTLGALSSRERLRRIAMTALFALHTVRFAVYLRPGSGRRSAVPAEDLSGSRG